MAKIFEKYRVTLASDYVDHKTGKTISTPRVWRSVYDKLPDKEPTEDTAWIFDVKIGCSPEIIELAYLGNGKWADTAGKEYRDVRYWLEYIPQKSHLEKTIFFISGEMIRRIVSDYVEKSERAITNHADISFKIQNEKLVNELGEYEVSTLIGCNVPATIEVFEREE